MTTTTTIDGGARRPFGMASSRQTPIWGMQQVTVTTKPADIREEVCDGLPGDPLAYARPAYGRASNAAQAARAQRLVVAAVEAGETTRGRPPPVSATLVVAAQAAFLAAAVLNVVLW